jgi:rod shape determining protein RodA
MSAPSLTTQTSPRAISLALPFDPFLVVGVFGIAVASLMTLKGATAQDVPGSPNYYVLRQAMFFAIGTLAAILVSRVDYSRLREIKYVLYAGLILAIGSVYFLGADTRGSRRAIPTPIFEIQFSELGKVILIVIVAAFLVERARYLRDGNTAWRAMILAGVPAALVISQDLGSGIVYIASAFAVLFVVGTPGRQLWGLFAAFATVCVIALAVAPAAGVNVLKTYQSDRLTSFLHPSSDPADPGYQQNQSKIAIGSGGKTGRGENATQTKLNYLPEHHTDFVFAVVGERWGFVGAGLVLSLYALLIWRGLRILTISKNLFGALIAGGIVGMLFFEVVVNVGMNVGLMPITGIPLPMLSYGGSSVISTLLAIGLLQAIYSQARSATATNSRILNF